jgi:hypothetical protein
MSEKPRCKSCLHQRGPRSTNNMAQAADKPTKHGIQAKKAPCVCACHD